MPVSLTVMLETFLVISFQTLCLNKTVDGCTCESGAMSRVRVMRSYMADALQHFDGFLVIDRFSVPFDVFFIRFRNLALVSDERRNDYVYVPRTKLHRR